MLRISCLTRAFHRDTKDMTIENRQTKALSTLRKTLAMTAMAGFMLAAPLAQALELRLKANESKMLSLAGEPSTVIVSNPVFADATVLGKKVVIQARAPGATRVTILNSDGQQLASLDVVIGNDSPRNLRLYRGGARYTYVCTPNCEPTLAIGDSDKATSALASQLGQVNGAVKSSMEMGN